PRRSRRLGILCLGRTPRLPFHSMPRANQSPDFSVDETNILTADKWAQMALHASELLSDDSRSRLPGQVEHGFDMSHHELCVTTPHADHGQAGQHTGTASR